MLKFKIDTEAHDALSDAHKELYTQVGDEYVLAVDGAADAAEVERLKQHAEKLIGEKRQRDEAAKQAQAERERIEQEALKKNGDFEALEKSYQERDAVRQAELDRLYQERDTSSISRESQRIASQLSDTPRAQNLLQRFIKDRLKVVDGEVKVVDKDGKPSASKVDDLVNEFKNCGDYDDLLTGTRGSGTGGGGQGSKGAKPASEYTEAERIELATKNPELFKQLF